MGSQGTGRTHECWRDCPSYRSSLQTTQFDNQDDEKGIDPTSQAGESSNRWRGKAPYTGLFQVQLADRGVGHTLDQTLRAEYNPPARRPEKPVAPCGPPRPRGSERSNPLLALPGGPLAPSGLRPSRAHIIPPLPGGRLSRRPPGCSTITRSPAWWPCSGRLVLYRVQLFISAERDSHGTRARFPATPPAQRNLTPGPAIHGSMASGATGVAAPL
jgi:hypothetical protein